MDYFEKFIKDTWLSLLVTIALIFAWILRKEKSRIDQELSDVVDKEHLQHWEKSLFLTINKNISDIKHDLDLRLSKIENSFGDIQDSIKVLREYKHQIQNEKSIAMTSMELIKQTLEEANRLFDNLKSKK